MKNNDDKKIIRILTFDGKKYEFLVDMNDNNKLIQESYKAYKILNKEVNKWKIMQ